MKVLVPESCFRILSRHRVFDENPSITDGIEDSAEGHVPDFSELNLRLIAIDFLNFQEYIGTLTWKSTAQPANADTARFKLQNKVEPIYSVLSQE